MTTKFIALTLMVLTLTACGFTGGNVFPDHPDWANEAWERQQQAGSE